MSKQSNHEVRPSASSARPISRALHALGYGRMEDLYPSTLHHFEWGAYLAFCVGVWLIAFGCAPVSDSLPQDDPAASSSGGSDGAEPDDEDPPNDDGPLSCDALAEAVEATLETHCGGCHSGATAIAGFGFVTDVERLVSEGYVVPGDAAGSELWARVSSGQMPPFGLEPRPIDDEIDALGEYIDTCLVPACVAEDRVPTEEVLTRIALDLADLEPEDRRFQRYLSLGHLYGTGRCSADLEVWRHALAKAVNSLSTASEIVRPQAIDDEAITYRVDLRDYGWSPELWESIASQSPYAVDRRGLEANVVEDLTETRVPLLPGDWLVVDGLRPPLYHEILELPLLLGELEAQLGIDIEADVQANAVARSGFAESGVSVNNRLIERHMLPGNADHVFWISYDFAGNTGLQNLFAHPLDFEEAGGEAIWSLPNGLHAYLLVDAAGNRLDQGPAEIVTDPAMPDGQVVNGLSCMRCHNAGIIPKTDELLDYVTSSSAFDPATKAKVAASHPPAEEQAELQAFDADVYLAALAEAGVLASDEEPTSAVFREYSNEVDLARAAAELGVSDDELAAALPGLAPELQPLGSGLVVKREAWEVLFGEAACLLEVGVTAACGGVG